MMVGRGRSHALGRDQSFTPTEEQLYLDLYEQTRLERERAFQKSNDRGANRWPLSAVRF
jgi:hypothetical protein